MTAISVIQKNIGVVIFTDIDKYMTKSSKMTLDTESIFIKHWRENVEKICADNHFFLARSFGDGFLFYTFRENNNETINSTLSFLRSISSFFDIEGFSIRGSFAFGLFEVSHFKNINGGGETAIVGPVVNFAGKLLSKAQNGEIIGVWQKFSSNSYDITFDDLSKDEGKRLTFWKIPSKVPLNINSSNLEECNNPLLIVTANVQQTQLAFSDQIKIFILETTKIADDKAKSSFGVAAGLLVFLFNFSGSGFFISNANIKWSFSFSFLIELLSLLFLALSCLFSFITFVPRQTTKFPRGLAFYGSIAEWESASNYLKAIKSRSSNELIDELTSHNYELSKVSKRKFYWLKFSLWCLGFGISLMFLRYFLIRVDL